MNSAKEPDPNVTLNVVGDIAEEAGVTTYMEKAGMKERFEQTDAKQAVETFVTKEKIRLRTRKV